MRPMITLFCMLLSFFAPGPGRALAADADPYADDRAALIKVFREIEASINAQDVDRMVKQMHPLASVTWLF